MESIDNVIDKKLSKTLFAFIGLFDPQHKYKFDSNTIDAWNRLSLTDQRKLYLYLLYRKWRGIDIYGEPYYIIANCHPQPYNWNNHSLCESLINERKAVIAKYLGSFGTYTRDEAKLYGMTDIHSFN